MDQTVLEFESTAQHCQQQQQNQQEKAQTDEVFASVTPTMDDEHLGLQSSLASKSTQPQQIIPSAILIESQATDSSLISQSDNPQEEFRSTKSSDDVISPSEIPKSLSQSSPPEHEADRNSAKGESKDENGFIFYKCRFCGLTYNYLTTLRAHERVHNIDEPYKCNRCSESFHYLCELEYHAKQHTDLKGYKCECGRTFHTYTDLLYHKHPEDENEEVIVSKEPIKKPASSPVPEDSFPVPEFMEKGFEPKHPMKVYSDIRLNPYICQYCSKSYPNSRMLAYHMYGHRGEKIFNPRASRYLMARSETSFSRSLGSPKGTL